MRLPIPTRRLAAAGLALLMAGAAAGCAPRRLQYTFTKPRVSEQQLNQDQAELSRTSGVKQVLVDHHMDDSVTLLLYVDEGNPLPGKQAAVDLGYSQVRQ